MSPSAEERAARFTWGEEDRPEQGGNEKQDIWEKEQQTINKQSATHPCHNPRPPPRFLGVSEAVTVSSSPTVF